jgi:hypothetical protein
MMKYVAELPDFLWPRAVLATFGDRQVEIISQPVSTLPIFQIKCEFGKRLMWVGHIRTSKVDYKLNWEYENFASPASHVLT